MIPYRQRRMADQIMEAFTRQHYTAIAGLIKDMKGDFASISGDSSVQDSNKIIKEFAERLASMFKQDNSSFDKSRFMSACGF